MTGNCLANATYASKLIWAIFLIVNMYYETR